MRVACATMSAPGHAFPMLALAKEIAARAHLVTFVCGAEHREAAERAGCRYADFPEGIDGSPRDSLRLYDDAASMARSMIPQFRDLEPDVVVHDAIALGPALAAEALGIPVASLIVHPLHTYSADLPPFGLGRRLIPLLEANVRRNTLRDLTGARDDLNRARAALRLAPTERLDGQLSRDLILVATLPSLERLRRDWPAQAHVIGPLLWDGAGDVPALPPGDRPLVLIAPSTAHDVGAFVDAAVNAVASSGARGLLTGPRPRDMPPGIVHVPFAPHDALLEQADAVITSGGHGIVARALTHGVPLVIVPGPGDQRENGARVAATGAAIRVRRPKKRAIRRALRRLVEDPRYGMAAQRLATEAANLDGPRRGADLIGMMAEPRRVDRGEAASL
ncbi:MAG TPA: nucleotide disphospho-sugar-binding domain-containing protein [Actinomycetota bacterium]